MSCHRDAPVQNHSERPAVEVADILRAHAQEYMSSHTLTGDQLNVVRDLIRCRTSELGGHLEVCLDCGFERPAYNSCRNRHCPKCQSLTQARWIEQRVQRLLPTHYFHVVFTLPASLRALARANRELFFNLLFSSASKTLLELGDDPKRLNARLGITAVLHTWTRELVFHPHLHCIVTGGGLSPSGDEWIACNRRYIFPVLVLGKLFRGKFLDGLRRLRTTGALRYTGSAAYLADDFRFRALIDKLYATSWVVYAKRPFAGPENIFRYLGRYTHRVGLSNQRLQSFSADGVRFATKGGKSITIDPLEFIHRFLEHVLPAGFTKIRHFGLHASANVNTKLRQALQALTKPAASPSSVAIVTEGNNKPNHGDAVLSWQELLLTLTGFDVARCPRCNGTLERRPLRLDKPSFEDTS